MDNQQKGKKWSLKSVQTNLFTLNKYYNKLKLGLYEYEITVKKLQNLVSQL